MADDPELVAMATVKTALEPLDEETRARVLRWAAERYSVPLQLGKGRSGAGAQDTSGGGGDRSLEDFPDVASLVAAANATTDIDRVLVVSTWFQVRENHAAVTSKLVNDALKNLGYGVTDMTNTFNRLMDKSPRLVIQLQKSGRSRQSRKQYKVTDAGIKRVGALIAGTAPAADD
jgi:hypothetical protein